MEYRSIKFEIAREVATVTLARPNKLNALTPQMADEMRHALAHTDVVIVDERAWKALDATAHERLRAAVRDGLGLLLRVTGALPDDVAADWRTLGFRVRAADVPQTFTLQTPAGGSDASTTLTRRALLVEADDATPLLRGSDGTPAALWRGDGLGRVAIWWAADTYRIALGGDAAAFGTLWSRALATVARARSRARHAGTAAVPRPG